MGAKKVSIIQGKRARQQAMQHVLQDLSALEIMLDEGYFETDVQRIGAEQELHFAGQDWRPAPVAVPVLDSLKDDPRFTTELAQFNLEINLDPLVFTGTCLRQLEQDLYTQLKRVELAARQHGAHAVLAGVLPTIRERDIDLKNLTPEPRYQMMMELLSTLRDRRFDFRIEGPDELIIHFDHPMFEAVTASFQVHYQVSPADFPAAYNWAQLITAPVLAAATHSPILLGRRLWRESRIALFQQSIDVRHATQHLRQHPARVSFGTAWVGDSPLDTFKDIVSRYRLLLISERQEDALEVLKKGQIPKLYGLNVHSGTVYKWNRACYGITDGKPHLRIENRVLPSGPTIIDEVANAAFWLGLMKGMPESYRKLSGQMNFSAAKDNFLRAARQGLGATFHWIDHPKPIPADQLILRELLPIARAGLQKANIATSDIDTYLGIIEERVKSGRTGSQWLLSSYESLLKNSSRGEALGAVTAGLSRRQRIGKPVHTWSLAQRPEAGKWWRRYQLVEQVMNTDLVTVQLEDTVDYVAHLMKWRNIRHVPVENEAGQLCGLVSAKNMLSFFTKSEMPAAMTSISAIMTTELQTVTPETSLSDALTKMRLNDISCVPVLRGDQLIGLITERDATRLLEEIYQESTEQTPV